MGSLPLVFIILSSLVCSEGECWCGCKVVVILVHVKRFCVSYWQLKGFVWGCSSLGAEYLDELEDYAAQVCNASYPCGRPRQVRAVGSVCINGTAKEAVVIGAVAAALPCPQAE